MKHGVSLAALFLVSIVHIVLGDIRAGSYRAASVIHFPLNISSTSLSMREIKQVNLNRYEELVAEAAAQGAQIIVFPESGTGFLMVPLTELRAWCEPTPSPGWRAENCTSGTSSSTYQHAHWASCTSQKYGLDIVINFGVFDEVQQAYFNANAAFNRDGFLLAVYHKSHINAVPELTQPKVPDAVTFVSSFGVTFGMFICYDMWFQQPITEEIDRLGVTDFAYPNGMSSLAPLFIIDEIHAGWSLVHQVNLVSAGLFPTAGAGSFHRGQVLAINPQLPFDLVASNVVVAEVPMIASRRQQKTKTSMTKRSDETSENGQNLLSSAVKSTGIDCFNGSASCAYFVPKSNVTFLLAASFSGPFANVSCAATVTTMSTSIHTWMLVASQLDMVPASRSTPDDNEAAFCLLIHCDTPEAGCSFGSPVPSYWTSDLVIRRANVTATLGKGMSNASNVLFYPIYGFVNRTELANSSIQFPLAFPPADCVYAHRSSGPDSAFLNVELSGSQIGLQNVFSAGVYAASKGPSWNGGPSTRTKPY